MVDRAFVTTSVLIFAVGIFKITKNVQKSIAFLPIPSDLNINRNWGSNNETKIHSDEVAPQPFKIVFSEQKIKELKATIAIQMETLPEPLEGAKNEYGLNLRKLKEIANYWKDSYLAMFDERLKYMNRFPNFITQVQGLHIHYVHVIPENPTEKKIVPILLLHGWPSSFLDFYEMIPFLSEIETNGIVFECIVPSLPGHGFSGAAKTPGLGITETAILLRNLMVKLGKDQFYVQGGDWGSYIGKTMTSFFPGNVLGLHSNWLAIGTPFRLVKAAIATICPKSWFVQQPEHCNWFFPISAMFIQILKESGQIHQHVTKPDTIGAALSSNPLGLAAYILQTYSSWGNSDFERIEGLDSYNLDRLIDNVMM